MALRADILLLFNDDVSLTEDFLEDWRDDPVELQEPPAERTRRRQREGMAQSAE